MEFIKSFNNNAALVRDSQKKEWIVVGSGVSFGKKPGDSIDEAKVDRYFVAQNDLQEIATQLEAVSSVQDHVLETTTAVIKLVEKLLNVTFGNYQYLSLADHLNFAIERAHEHIVMNVTATRWELESLYPLEYQAAQQAKALIETTHMVTLPESEITFLTYHFVNAQSEAGTMNDTVKMTQLIQQTIDLVQRSAAMHLPTDDFHYTRFITHLRFFILKKMRNEVLTDDDLDPILIKTLQTKYASAYEIAKKIAAFYAHQENWTFTTDECLYLSLHIWRLTQAKNK